MPTAEAFRGAAHRRYPDSTLCDGSWAFGGRPGHPPNAARQRLTGRWPLAGLQAPVPAQRLAAPDLHRGARGLHSGKGTASLGEIRLDGSLTCQELATLAPAAGQIGLITLQNPWSGAGSNRWPSAFQVHLERWRDSARHRLTGHLAAKIGADRGLPSPGSWPRWLPFGSPFGSPELRRLRYRDLLLVGNMGVMPVVSRPGPEEARRVGPVRRVAEGLHYSPPGSPCIDSSPAGGQVYDEEAE